MPTTRRGLFRALANVLTVLFLVAAVPLTVGIYGQAFVEADQRTRFPPPGQLVDIGGGEVIHVRTWGAPNDKPTLLLFVSAYAVSSAWAWIAQGLEADYRVVAFDRPGMGWSSGGSGPRDAAHAAAALQSALRIAGAEPPYIVVAHSYGGFSARLFVAENRDDVRSLVLLDTSHPDAPGSGYGFFARLGALRAHAGMQLLFAPGTGYSSLPPEEAKAANVVTTWTSHLDASADELETWDQSADEVRQAGGFGSLPLLILAAYEPEDQRRYQLDLVHLSTASEFKAIDSGHIEMLIDQDRAAVVANEIASYLARVLP